MKTLIKTFFVLSLGISMLCGCSGGAGKENADRKLITEKIEYPVFIKNPYDEENGEWWKENIETSKRTDFVKTLFDWVYEGKVKAFDYLTNKPLSIEEVKAIGNESDTIRITETFPPYDEKDTVIQNKLDLQLVHKLKFIEEWSFDFSGHTMEKKILGIAPALTVYGDSLEVKGYKPMFWIYFDEDFIKSLDKKE